MKVLWSARTPWPAAVPGDVRAVIAAVERIRVRVGGRRTEVAARVVIVAGEVVAVDHLGGREGAVLDDGRVILVVGLDGAGAAEVGVRVVDARVDHGDRLAGAGGAAHHPRRRGADVRDRLDVVGVVRRETTHADDAAHRRHAGHLGTGRTDLDAVVGVLVAIEHLAADRVDPRVEPSLGRAQGLRTGHAVGVVAGERQGRLGRELEDDGDLALGVGEVRPERGIDLGEVAIHAFEVAGGPGRECRGREAQQQAADGQGADESLHALPSSKVARRRHGRSHDAPVPSSNLPMGSNSDRTSVGEGGSNPKSGGSAGARPPGSGGALGRGPCGPAR